MEGIGQLNLARLSKANSGASSFEYKVRQEDLQDTNTDPALQTLLLDGLRMVLISQEKS